MPSEKVSHISRDDNNSEISETLQAVTSSPLSLNEVASQFTSDQKYYILKAIGYDSLESLDQLPVAVSYMMQKIQDLPADEAVKLLQEFLVEHEDDVNITPAELDYIRRLVKQGESQEFFGTYGNIDEKTEKAEKSDVAERVHEVSEADEHGQYDIFDWDLQVRTQAGIVFFHSPYQEVRAVTDAYDDPTMYCETVRVYILGAIWVAIGAFINNFFMQRQPSILLNTAVVQLFLYPSGLLMAWILPKWKFTVFGQNIDLNPGPWNHKEQMLATVFYSVSGSTPYVAYNIPVLKMKMFYGVEWAGWGYQILLMFATNFLGFGFAGIMRKFAVYPTRAIWPSILPTLALNKALLQSEPKENINGWTISRYRFFFLAFVASFLWFWFPDYIFTALSTFSWITWIAPDNLNLATITGSQTGLGLNPITTFDWNVINYNSPLNIPFFSTFNQYIGSGIAFFCIIGVWYSNYKWSGYMPINSNGLFTNTGDPYRVTKVLNKKSLLDPAKYAEYGPPFYTAANLVVYGAFFAIYPFSFIYVCMTDYKHIMRSCKGLWHSLKSFKNSTYDGFDDAFSKSMRHYKEVPEWAFLVILIISIVLSILCCKLYPTETPVWGIFFALGINFVFLIPLTFIYSITGFSFGLNVLVELIVGYALPGNGLALMFIKAIGYNIDGQAQNYITDQKMGHYLRIPPRALFRCQMVSVVICSFVSLAVINFAMDNIDDYCHPGQPQKFTCPSARTFYSSSVLWGVIGPKRVFDGLYPILKWCFLIGTLLAPVCFLIKKYFNKFAIVRYFQPTLIIGGFLIFAPYNLSYYTPGLIAAFFFMHVIKHRFTNWFKKYNYVLSGALTAGVAFSSIIIFFAVQYKGVNLDWWGNDVLGNGLDAMGPSLLNATELAPDGYFGPRIGHFP
ncbi:hypothetical protein PUMCH_001917 [Australozyma saopauloensis]|uniref:OPT family small oligopeptide transporter n=1 Tax=Australozyma saopauloensis TaxID=291208 RepID=A0AAX4H827_9ASCO|nr:hypothetical protein PUMCH_001917 [[Candida] saopauloensis]